MAETIEPDDEIEEETEPNAEDAGTEEPENEDAYDFPTPGGLRGL